MTQPSAKAFSLAAHFLQRPPTTPGDNSEAEHIAWQMDHRHELVKFWDIKPGSRVLELGCGQGDCTVVLAEAVGENGHVDAVDPGAPDYGKLPSSFYLTETDWNLVSSQLEGGLCTGSTSRALYRSSSLPLFRFCVVKKVLTRTPGSPYTLAQSQAYITSTLLGPRITFHLSTDPITFLSSLPIDIPPYDYIVLTHCIWYFESPLILSQIITSCVSKTKYLCIAEWSLRTSLPSSHPHILTALLLASLEAKRNIPSSGNIRTILSPKQISSNVEETGGFKLEKQEMNVTNEGMLDGYWETSYTLRTREKVLGRLKEQGVPEGELTAMVAMYDAVEASVGLLEVKEEEERVRGVRSMDFWVGRFAAV
jgi:hypothetical protein